MKALINKPCPGCRKHTNVVPHPFFNRPAPTKEMSDTSCLPGNKPLRRKHVTFFCNYIQISSVNRVTGGSGEQQTTGPKWKSSEGVKVLCDFQWQADESCSKQTPDWKALEAAKALTSCKVRACWSESS